MRRITIYLKAILRKILQTSILLKESSAVKVLIGTIQCAVGINQYRIGNYIVNKGMSEKCQ